MKIAVVGGGFTGLTAARELQEYCRVTVFESDWLGGLASSYCSGDYCIEKFYHHCFRGDEQLLELIRELKLTHRLEWRIARVGCELNGRIYPLNTPVEILRYPGMSFTDKFRLSLFTLRSRNRDYEKFDDIGVVEGIGEELGEKLYRRFFHPLLRGKFGENYRHVSYAWLLARVAIRSNRTMKGEELGYIRGGFHQLIERLAEGLEIRKERAEIRKNGRWIVNGDAYDVVIYTAPLPELDSGIRAKAGIQEIRYQSSVCCLVGSDSTITDDIYWTNLNSEAIFGAIIEHTHFMPFEDYGEHVIYFAGYTTPDSPLMGMEDKEVARAILKDAEKFGLRKEDVRWAKVFRAKYSGPIYEKGYLKKITPYRTPLPGLYIAGMTSRPNYPERSMNGSITAGKEVAKYVIQDYFT
jgi:protoporphyrinogen oxidase